MTQSLSDETIRVPKPTPDEVLVGTCSEDGAWAYVKVPKRAFTDEDWSDILKRVPELLADAERKLRDEYPRPV